MSLIGRGAVGLACAWLIVTLLFQFRPWSTRYPVLNRLGLLPIWKFYTQGNGAFDMIVEVRWRRDDGRWSEWTPLELPRRGPWYVLWYPEQHRIFAHWLACDALARRAARGKPFDAGRSLAYRTVLHQVRRSAVRRSSCLEHQFMVVRTPSAGVREDREILFVSGFHTL